jgi:hypothetical protein
MKLRKMIIMVIYIIEFSTKNKNVRLILVITPIVLKHFMFG